MGNQKNKRGRKNHSKAIRNTDDRTTYLGHPVTYWELENLDIEHQIHAMILHEHGLVDRHRLTEQHTALPLIDGRPIAPGPARDEACDALILMLPTGRHFESEDGLDDPYVWTRRGEEGDLTIKRFSKTQRDDMVGRNAFAIYEEAGEGGKEAVGTQVTGRKRTASTADVDFDDETGSVTSGADNEATVAYVDTEDYSTVSSFDVLNPPPPKKLRGWKVVSVSSKSKSARLKRAGLAHQEDQTSNREYSAPKIMVVEQPLSKMNTTKRGKVTQSRPDALRRKIKYVKPDNRAEASELLLPVDEEVPQPSAASKEHQVSKTKPKKFARPVQIGRPDNDKENEPLVGLPPMPMGKTVWKDQAWFDSVADPDTVAALSARSERARHEALEAISPLSSPGVESTVRRSDVQIEDLSLDTIRQNSTVKRTTVRMGKASRDLSIAEQKRPAALLLLDAHKEARMKPKVPAQENAQDRIVLSEIQNNSSVSKVPEKEPRAQSIITAVPAFVISAEKRRTNPLLDHFAMWSLAEVEALRAGLVTEDGGVISQQKLQRAQIAPPASEAREEKAPGSLESSTQFEGPGKKFAIGAHEVMMPLVDWSLIWMTPDTQSSIKERYYS